MTAHPVAIGVGLGLGIAGALLILAALWAAIQHDDDPPY